MPTAAMLQEQLAELRMVMDPDNPAHVEAEAAFAAIVSKLIREAELAENIAKWTAEQVADSMAKGMMLGTAEGYDGLSEHAERRGAPANSKARAIER
jgi:hypothetical protein